MDIRRRGHRGHWQYERLKVNTTGRRWGVRLGRDGLYDHAPHGLLVWRALKCWVWLAGRCYSVRTPFYSGHLKARG